MTILSKSIFEHPEAIEISFSNGKNYAWICLTKKNKTG